MKKLFLALALSAFSCLPAAAEPEAVDIMTPVPGHQGLIYLDLVRQVIPDLAANGDGATGHLPAGIGHLDGPEAVGEPPESVEIRHVQPVTVRAGGKPMLWVLADLGSGGNIGTYTLLAVFDDTARLLDAVEVDTDQLTGLVGAPFAISGGDDAMLIGSEHFNSSQSYQSRTIAFLHDGKLNAIDTILLFGTRSCDLWQTEELKVTAEENYNDYWTIFATVTRSKALAGQECEDPIDSDWRHRDFTASYTWISSDNAYAADRGDLDSLALQDEALF